MSAGPPTASEGASSHAPSMTSAPAKSDDPAWAHGILVEGKKNTIDCIYCQKQLKGGGITRLKQHLAGVKGEVQPCKSVPVDVKWQMNQMLEGHKLEKERRERISKAIGEGASYVALDEEEEESLGDRNLSGDGGGKKRKQTKTIGNFFAPRTTPGAQPSIKSALASKQTLDEARMAVARWWYDANIPFYASLSPYYQPAIDAMTAIGPGFKGPSYHDLRCPLLSNTVHEIKEYLGHLREVWQTYGCTVMSDGWTSQNQTPIMNFLVYCPKGTMFLKSIDTSGLVKDADTLFGIFCGIVDLVGPSNIVQFVTDNEASYKATGKRLQNHYGCFYWAPCAAHCLDLMLENFAKPKHFPKIDATIQKAKQVTRYIYNHAWVLDMMRKDFTNGRDLCRPGLTRFATNFLSLQCILNFRKELRQMFTSDKWIGSRYSKLNAGKEVAKILLEDGEFWCNCQLVVKISEPLVRVLRLTDGDEKPTMGYLYEAMDKAKEAIKVGFNNRLSQYMPYIRVIDARWDNQLHSPLHAAGCFLNPGIYFRPSFTKKQDVARGMIQIIQVLEPDYHVQDQISAQMESYKQSTGDFGMPLAIRQREKLNPAAWWEQFGSTCPHLQKFAIRVLSQCCSATGCERNWSTFEFIHSKRRNRLEHKRLNDLVYVRYNLKLRERNIRKGKDALDPISLENIDLMDEWVTEEPRLLDGEDISWEIVEPPSLEAFTLDDQEPLFDDAADDFPPENESLYDDLHIGDENDPFVYVALE